MIDIDAKTGDLKVVSDELGRLDANAKRAAGGVDSFSSKLKGLAVAATGVFTLAKAFDFLNGALDVTAKFEKFETVLGTIEGSSNKAKLSMKWIEDFAAKTPYQLDQVTDSFVKLKAYGLEAKDGLLKTLGDTAAAMGKDLNQAVEAMADAVMGENERLKEFGIKAAAAADKITYRWSTASGKAKKITIANNKEIIQSTLEAIFNSKYAGAMENMSKTWDGVVSNMEDSWTKFKKDLMTKSGLFDDLKDYIKEFSDYFKDSADDWVKSFGDFYKKIKANKDIFEPFMEAGKDLWEIIKAVFSDSWELVKDFFNLFSDESDKTVSVLDHLGGLFKGVGLSIKNFTTVLKIAYKEMKMWGDYIGTSFRRSFASAQLEWEKAILGMYKAMDKIPFADYTKEIAEQTKAVQLQKIAVDKITDSYNIRNAAGEAEIDTLRGEIKSFYEIGREMRDATIKLSNFSTKTKTQTTLNKKNTKTLKDVKGAVDDMGSSFAKNGKKSEKALKALEEANRKAYEENLNIWMQYFDKIGDEESANQIKRYKAAVKYKDQLKGITGEQLNDQLDMLAGIKKGHNKAAQEIVDIWKDAAKQINEGFEKSLSEMFKTGSFSRGFDSYFDSLKSTTMDTIVKGLMSGKSGNILDLVKGGISTGFNTTSGDISKVLQGFWLESGTASMLGGAGAAAMYGKEGGELYQNLLGGSKTKAPDYASAGAAIGSVIPGVGTLAGGAIGAVIGGFNAKWQKKGEGISIGEGGLLDAQKYAKYKKDKVFGFADKKKYEYSALDAETKQYLSTIAQFAAEVGSFRGKDKDLKIEQGRYTTKELDDAIADSLLKKFTTREKTSGSGFIPGISGLLKEQIDVSVMKAKFSEYAKEINSTVVDAIINSFKFEKGMLDKLDSSLEGAFGDFGEKIYEKIADTFKNSKLETIPDFDVKYSDMILNAIAEQSRPAATEVADVAKKSALNFWGAIKQATKDVFAMSKFEIDKASMKKAWEDWATQHGVTVVEAINAGLEAVQADKKNWEQFFNDYFDLDGSVEVMAQKMRESSKKFFDMVNEIDGAAGVNLKNFEQMREAMTSGVNFTPENIQNWHELQGALQEAATETKNFADSLQGLIGQYGDVIAKFDEVIAQFNGYEIEQQEVQQATLASVQEMANAVIAATNNQQQLEYSQKFLTEIQKLNADQDARFQELLDGDKSNIDALTLEFNQTLAVGLENLATSITQINEDIKQAQEEGDSKTVEKLMENLKTLQEQQTRLEDIAQRADTEGVESVVAEWIDTNDIAFGMMTETVKGALVKEKQSLEQLLAETNAILTRLEGAMTDNTAMEELKTELVNWNMSAEQANTILQTSLDTLPENIGTTMTTSLQPVTDAVTNLPQTVTDGMTTAIQPVQTALETTNTNLAALPETFNTAIEPLGTAMQELPTQIDTSLTTAMTPIAENLTTLGTAVSEMGVGITTGLQEGFTAIGTGLAEVGTTMTTSLETMSASLATNIETLGTNIGTSLETVSANLETMGTNITTSIETNLATVTENITAMSDSMTTQIEAMSTDISTALETNLQTVSDNIETLTTDMANNLESLGTDLSNTIETNLKTVSDDISTMTDSMETELGNLSDEITKSLDSNLKAVSDDISNMSKDLSNDLDTLGTEIETSLTSNFKTISTDLTNVANNIDSMSTDIGNKITNSLKPIDTTLSNMDKTISNLPTDIENSFKNSINPLVTSMDKVVTKMGNLGNDIGTKVNEGLKPITTAISGLNSKIGELVNAEKATTSAVNNSASSIASAISGKLNGLYSKLNSAIDASNKAATAAANAASAASRAASSTSILTGSINKLSTVVNQNTQAQGAA